MLLKYLTQSKIRLIVKAPVVILSVLQKNMQRASHFKVLTVHANCRLYSLKQKLLQSIMCSFLRNFVLLILLQSFVLQSYFKGQWNFRPFARRFPTSTGLWVSAVWIVHCYYKTVPNCHRSKNALLCQTILYCSTIRSQKVPLQRTKNIHKTRHDWTCTPLIKNKMGPNSSLGQARFKSESMQKSTKIADSWQGSKIQNRSSFADWQTLVSMQRLCSFFFERSVRFREKRRKPFQAPPSIQPKTGLKFIKIRWTRVPIQPRTCTAGDRAEMTRQISVIYFPYKVSYIFNGRL